MMPYGDKYSGRYNVIISPTMLMKMEESTNVRIAIENKILKYMNENTNILTGGLQREILSSGIIFNGDGTVSYWSIPEYDNIFENQKSQNQDYITYKNREENQNNSKITNEEVAVKRKLYDGILPLYNLTSYTNKENIDQSHKKIEDKKDELSLLERLRQKYIGINIHIKEINNNDKIIYSYSSKCNSELNVCIAPIIYNEMEKNIEVKHEVEENIIRYVNQKLEEKFLHKIFETKPMISGEIFHKDGTVTQWSRILKGNSILYNLSEKNNSKSILIIRQLSKDGQYTIRKLSHKH